MARETSAERVARQVAEADARFDAEEAAYPAKFLAVLSAAVAEGFDVVEVTPTGMFVLRDNRDCERFTVYNQYQRGGEQWDLEGLEGAVNEKVNLRLEAERVESVRRTALSKLTKDEKEALGL